MSNKILGGKGDKLDYKKVDQSELKKGIKHEMEHTNSSIIAKEIALDHLAEDPKYYSRLEKAGIDEIKRMQKLAGIKLNELGINNPNVRMPEGWSEIELNDEDIKEDIIHWFFAPMNGHDEDHTDDVKIIERKDNKFVIETSYAFDETKYEPNKFGSINLALKRAYEIMKEISDDWDDEYNDDEEWEDEDD